MGLDTSKFTGHIFRIGAATTAAVRGVEDSLIKTLGHWERSAYLLYVHVHTKVETSGIIYTAFKSTLTCTY